MIRQKFMPWRNNLQLKFSTDRSSSLVSRFVSAEVSLQLRLLGVDGVTLCLFLVVLALV